MPTLHELFDAATDGMPPLPDLAPAARRIARRRQLTTRTATAVLSSALVIGAGTFALSVQHPGPGTATDAASSPPRTFSEKRVLETLQSVWPNKNQQLRLSAGGYGVTVSQDGQNLAYLFFTVAPDVANYPKMLACTQGDVSCITAMTPDGDKVLSELGNFYSQQVTLTTPPPAVTGASPVTTPTPHKYAGIPVSGTERGYRLHDTYFAQLTFDAESAPVLTDRQLLTIVESSAFEELIDSSVGSSSFDWLGTPPAGLPSATTSYGPSPSDSGH